MLRTLLDLLFPIRSLQGRKGEWITDSEWSGLRDASIVLERAQLRDRNLLYLERIVAAGSYDQSDLLRRAIWMLKYTRLPGIAVPLGTIMADAVIRIGFHADILCPVPLHWTRRFERGFNQAELLAQPLSLRTNLPINDVLYRARRTGQQAKRATRAERFEALRDAFVAQPTVPKSILLVDDVATTGATLDACAAALRRAGAQHVEAVVLALG